jgi:uncharacterized protein (TIGR02001 family)
MCAALAHVAAAHGADGWGGSIGAVSDYAHRGLSQTRGDPALQIGVFRELPANWSVGAGASMVDFGEWADATYEVNVNLTHTWMLGERWSAQASYTRYLYPGERGDYDYDEWTASLNYRQRMTATIAMLPEGSTYGYGMTAGRAMSYELATLQPVSERWSLVGGAGYYDLHESFRTGYWFWSAGFAFAWDALQLDLLHIDTDAVAVRLFGRERAGSRWSAALMWKF